MKNFLASLTIGLISFTGLSADYYSTDGSDCGCCANNQVNLCCPDYTFGFEFNALYLQPSGSNLHYVAEAEPLPLPTPNWFINDIKPDYHFGYEVGASVICHERNSKTALKYVHFHSKDSASKVVSSSNMVGPFFEIGPDASPYSRAKGHVAFNYDAIRLDYGVCVKFGDCLKTNFFAGIDAARIDEKYSTFYSNQEGNVARRIKTPSSFLGIGPELGLDFSYGICDGLHFIGEGSAALLVGKLKNHTSYKSISPFLEQLDITPPNSQSTHVNDRTGVVPAFDGKLGLSYSFSTCDCVVSLEAGYEVKLYVNAIQSVDIGSEVVTPPVTPDTVGVYARTFQRTASNFALAGPYLRLDIRF